MITYVFPGQGSQSRGMGAGLFERYQELTDKADKILGYSIKELCLEDPRRELNKTQFTQPALFFVNALTYYSVVEDTGKKPDFVAGHSLGEYNALLAAECFDLEAGLKMVKKRGELMSEAPKGGMAAILNSSKEEIEETLKKNDLTGIDIANFNTRSQIVLSGPIQDMGKAQNFFQGGEIMYVPLNTGGAFHSRYMQPITEKFETYLKRFKLSDLKIPVISNVTARPYDEAHIIQNLANQISTSVRWSESVEFLLEIAKKSDGVMTIKEVGHGDVLTKILTRIMNETGYSAAQQPKDDKTDNIIIEETSDIGEKIKFWNSKYPVGTKVKSLVLDYDELETRTEAVVLFGHRAAIYMKGYKGYFDLNEIKVI